MSTLRFTIKDLESRGPIRIDKAEAWRVAIPMLEPFRISSGEVSTKDSVVVRLSHGEYFGWGESSAMPGAFYSEETPDTCERELVDRILPELAGQSFATVLDYEKALDRITNSRFVRVALETAAWELLARQAGQSLRQYLGLPERSIPAGLAVGLYASDEELHDALERYQFRKYRRLKIKIKPGFDVRLVRAVREWYGEIPLFVDANAAYSMRDLEIFEQLDRYDMMMFEQPFAKDDMEGSAALQAHVRTPVCFDESVETAEDARRAAKLQACKIVNVKLQRIGGYLEAMRVAECCVQNGIDLWMGTMPELGIGSAQAIMFGAHPGCTYPTDVEPSARWFVDDILAQPLVLAGGSDTWNLPAGPGLGFTVDMDSLQRHSLRHWSF